MTVAQRITSFIAFSGFLLATMRVDEISLLYFLLFWFHPFFVYWALFDVKAKSDSIFRAGIKVLLGASFLAGFHLLCRYVSTGTMDCIGLTVFKIEAIATFLIYFLLIASFKKTEFFWLSYCLGIISLTLFFENTAINFIWDYCSGHF